MLVGPAIPAPVDHVAPTAAVLNFSTWVLGWLRVIWRWSLKHTFMLLLSIDWSWQEHAMLPLNFAKVVFRRFGPPRAKVSLLVDTFWVGVVSLHGATPLSPDYHCGGNSDRPENILAELFVTFELPTGIVCGNNSVTQFDFDPLQFLFSYS